VLEVGGFTQGLGPPASTWTTTHFGERCLPFRKPYFLKDTKSGQFGKGRSGWRSRDATSAINSQISLVHKHKEGYTQNMTEKTKEPEFKRVRMSIDYEELRRYSSDNMVLDLDVKLLGPNGEITSQAIKSAIQEKVDDDYCGDLEGPFDYWDVIGEPDISWNVEEEDEDDDE
jgi:hypothetical protein